MRLYIRSFLKRFERDDSWQREVNREGHNYEVDKSTDHKSDSQCKTHEGHNYEVNNSTDYKSDSQCKAHEGHNYEVNKSTDHKSDSQCKTYEGHNCEGDVQINRSEV